MVKIALDYIKTVNFAIIRNGVPVCRNFEIEFKDGLAALSNVVVTCEGEFIKKSCSKVFPEVTSGATIRLKDFEIIPDPSKLAELTERIDTAFCITVYKDGESEAGRTEIGRQEFPIELMTFDHWLGTNVIPQSLVSFVTPNHPAISQLIVKAAKHLKDISESSAFTEYQTMNPNEVTKQVAAVFAALHDEGIVYRSLPPDYESTGQRVTLPAQVLSSKLGNCIELSVLFASVLESIGINSCIIIQHGHAFLGIWLVDDCSPYSVSDDASFIEKKISNGIRDMMVLECTHVTSENAQFSEAVRTAEHNLADLGKFVMSIDVRRSRLEHFLPLPLTKTADGSIKLDATLGVEHDHCDFEVQEHSRYDLTRNMKDDKKLTRLDIWERKLLDFSLRNSMLNLYLRQRAVQCISFDVDKIEDHLQDGEEYCVLPRPDIDIKIDQEERLIRSKLMEPLHDLITDDIKHRKLHTYQTESETNSVLKNIYRSARNAIEETGANSLFFAIGTLRWYETDISEKARYAPILMLPIEMVYKKGGYYIRTRDEDIMLNVTLFEFLRQNFDITVSGLTPLPKDDHGVDVSLIFAIIREALKDKKRWDVEEECIIGVFSFSKFLMWNDIHSHRDELLQNDIVRSLTELKLTWQPTAVKADLSDEDKTVLPTELTLPVAVDSSQMASVYEAGRGNSFVLYGPPGTGKSQTITNLIANALFHGKRILFVAEKMAALSVVQKRLEDIGLAPFCLEMHSNKIAKRHVLDQLASALAVRHIASPGSYEETAGKLFAKRSELISHMEAMHQKDADGFSVYDCILRYESYNSPEFDNYERDENLSNGLTSSSFADYEHLLHDRLLAVTELIGQPSQHPLLGLRVTEKDLSEDGKLRGEFVTLTNNISDCNKDYSSLAETKSLRQRLLKDNNESLLGENGKELYDEWRSIRIKWFLPKFFAKRSFLKRLRTHSPYITEADIEPLLDALMNYQEQHSRIASLRSSAAQFFSLDSEEDTLPSENSMLQMTSKLASWEKNLSMLRDWYHWYNYAEELRSKGLSQVVTAFESGVVSPESFSDSFFKAYFHDHALQKIAASPVLRTFEGMMFDEQVNHYKQLAADFQQLSAKELYARLASRIPVVTENIDNSSEIGLLNRNISNGARGLSLRDLFDQIPNLLPRLCPCMLMSPMSVAQYVNLGQDKFDLVIFDEASQMPTSEAVGAIARGKALVVVGDPKQMPPTSFFSSTNVDEEEAYIDDMESILEDCRTLGMPEMQLNWHYRSRHESLIAFSNSEYYDGKLVTFPSVDDQNPKVRLFPVAGVYDKGGKRFNIKEAEAVVDEVTRRLLSQDGRSIGVIAFSVVQQNKIEDLLQDRLDKDSKLKEAADALYEPIFIKNLENVQGDERDVILFSIGYGPDKDGKVSMNFGPLNNAGGERRLNVAVSRARQEMLIFSSMKASQIDLRRSKALGVKGLHDFLEYAERGELPLSSADVTEQHDTIIATQIADALTHKGYVTKVNVGRSSFKVDVAVCKHEQPEVYSLGILLDGERYCSTQTTRDREIVQPSVLGGLRWKVMRVWSVDWLNNRNRVLDRIVKVLNSDDAQETATPIKSKIDVTKETIVAQTSVALPYESFSIEGYEQILYDDMNLTRAIVEKEYPITLMLLCRRVCSMRGEARVTPSMLDNFSYRASYLYTECEADKLIIWPNKEARDGYQSFRYGGNREVDQIPQVEIRNAIMEAVREQFSILRSSLTLIVAKKLGFTRRGSKVDLAINSSLDSLITKGIIAENEGKLTSLQSPSV